MPFHYIACQPLYVMQCHVVQGKPKEILSLYQQIDSVIAEMMAGSIPMEHRPGIMRGQHAGAWLGVCDVNYLGTFTVPSSTTESVEQAVSGTLVCDSPSPPTHTDRSGCARGL